MFIIETDSNQFLADGKTPNPNFGVRSKKEIPDPPAPLKPAPTTKQQLSDVAAQLLNLISKLP